MATVPTAHRVMIFKRVFKVKKDAAGKIVKHKVRLVVKGYAQLNGVDFEKFFAPVAWMETVTLVLALVAHKKCQVHHMDMKMTFLNNDITEEVYVQRPPSFVDDNNKKNAFRLRKALYGLHHAPRAWNTKLDASLFSLGFTRSKLGHVVYTRGGTQSFLLMGVYVDHFIIMGTTVSICICCRNLK